MTRRSGERGELMAGTGKAHLRDDRETLLRVEDLVVEFPVGRTGLKVNAVSGISFDVLPGETLGLVGESGCGKSTTGQAIMQLPRPNSGSILFEGSELTDAAAATTCARLRTNMQMIFQDPISSLNPRRKVRDIVMEPLTIWKRRHASRARREGRRGARGGRHRSRRVPPRAGRTSSPAASASASPSPARSCSTRR